MLNRRQQRTLRRVFEVPTVSDLRWAELVSLLKALGATVDTKRKGSRVAIALGGRVLSLHRPHPKPVLKQYQVAQVRELLARTGHAPEE